ncbi:hypothetical protein RRG08_037312 [Elysia crispata]|uniref:Uncharacterized protein n=1 Tax=Elysia crispata TaxID=231223 RepID=A0AAE1DXW2_9GAST|nr:hypothetical protein RRG08_037312 [Elysia crispata]
MKSKCQQSFFRPPTCLLASVACLVISRPGVVGGTVNSGTCSSGTVDSSFQGLITVTHNTTVPSNLQGHLYNVQCMRDSSNSDHSESSTCPWYIQTDVDNWRIPHSISYVQCRCKNCSHHSVHGGLCKPVLREVSILRKYCDDDGKMQIKREFQTFPVACVCTPRQPATTSK